MQVTVRALGQDFPGDGFGELHSLFELRVGDIQLDGVVIFVELGIDAKLVLVRFELVPFVGVGKLFLLQGCAEAGRVVFLGNPLLEVPLTLPVRVVAGDVCVNPEASPCRGMVVGRGGRGRGGNRGRGGSGRSGGLWGEVEVFARHHGDGGLGYHQELVIVDVAGPRRIFEDERGDRVVDVGDRLEDARDLVAVGGGDSDLCAEGVGQRVDEAVLHVLVCGVVLGGRKNGVRAVLAAVAAVVAVGALGGLYFWKRLVLHLVVVLFLLLFLGVFFSISVLVYLCSSVTRLTFAVVQ